MNASPTMRILSGIQPSGAVHIGNYFGMMKPAIDLQTQGECYYFIADYHSMTSLNDAAERRQNTHDAALDFLACGLDPQKSVFFRQSDLPEVTELTWIIGADGKMFKKNETRRHQIARPSPAGAGRGG